MGIVNRFICLKIYKPPMKARWMLAKSIEGGSVKLSSDAVGNVSSISCMPGIVAKVPKILVKSVKSNEIVTFSRYWTCLRRCITRVVSTFLEFRKKLMEFWLGPRKIISLSGPVFGSAWKVVCWLRFSRGIVIWPPLASVLVPEMDCCPNLES